MLFNRDILELRYDGPIPGAISMRGLEAERADALNSATLADERARQADESADRHEAWATPGGQRRRETMDHFDATFPVMFGADQVAEIEVRITVEPFPVPTLEVETYALGHRWQKIIPTPEPMRTQILEWVWDNKRDEADELFASFVAGRKAYDREMSRHAG